jgi:hypothetical protein
MGRCDISAVMGPGRVGEGALFKTYVVTTITLELINMIDVMGQSSLLVACV